MALAVHRSKTKEFDFPLSQPERAQRWIAHTRRANWKPRPWSKLCSIHFKESDFDRTGATTRLRENVIPTIFDFPDNPKKAGKEIELLEAPPALPKPTAEKPDAPSKAVEKPNITAVHTSLPESHDHCYFTRDTPVVLKRKLDFTCAKLCSVNKRLRMTQQKCRRLEKKVCSLEATIYALQEKRPSAAASLDVLSETLPGIAVELLKRMSRSKKRGKACYGEYPAVVADFALKLMSLSPKAYFYTRKSFDGALPHPSLLRRRRSVKKDEAKELGSEQEDLNAMTELSLVSLMSTEELSQLLLPQTNSDV
ncbi:THAP domain-containing protein 1-like isoform X2 [Patiria miniata]|uniref:THAP-type domain-containing protein n=1 Tax=Patiria miniata TaxID=46514 RepID=A0A913ZZP7_PATMI|nr:THAP domain-containing protein 1-like isoform X2 [Patiria miniata]